MRGLASALGMRSRKCSRLLRYGLLRAGQGRNQPPAGPLTIPIVDIEQMTRSTAGRLSRVHVTTGHRCRVVSWRGDRAFRLPPSAFRRPLAAFLIHSTPTRVPVILSASVSAVVAACRR